MSTFRLPYVLGRVGSLCLILKPGLGSMELITDFRTWNGYIWVASPMNSQCVYAWFFCSLLTNRLLVPSCFWLLHFGWICGLHSLSPLAVSAALSKTQSKQPKEGTTFKAHLQAVSTARSKTQGKMPKEGTTFKQSALHAQTRKAKSQKKVPPSRLTFKQSVTAICSDPNPAVRAMRSQMYWFAGSRFGEFSLSFYRSRDASFNMKHRSNTYLPLREFSLLLISWGILKCYIILYYVFYFVLCYIIRSYASCWITYYHAIATYGCMVVYYSISYCTILHQLYLIKILKHSTL